MLALRLHSFPIVTTIKPVSFIASHILLYHRQIPKGICGHPSGYGCAFWKAGNGVPLSDMPMYYTSWRSLHTRHFGHCQSNGERRLQARTVTNLLYHYNSPYMDKEQNTPQNNGNSESDDKQAKTVHEPRCTTISFRVSRTQREHIGRLADKCGMTLSDYVLARSYNYLPKSRLTPEQEAVRDELITVRSDYARYTSMLNGMSQNERRAMFRNQPWMIGALQLLGRTAEAITRIIDRCFAPNRVPENPEIQEQTEDEP